MPISRVRRALRVSCALLAAGILAMSSEVHARDLASSERKVSEDVRRELASNQQASIVVELDEASALSHGIDSSSLELSGELESRALSSTQTAADAKLFRATNSYATAQRSTLDRLGNLGFELGYIFKYSPVFTLEVYDPSVLDHLEADEAVHRVRLCQKGRGAMTEVAPWIRSDQTHAAGFRGAGRVVAVLDTGIDRAHPDLSDAIILEKRFIDRGRQTDDDATDGHGHGTHVAGILASRGMVSPSGVAPEASLVVIKVLNDQNIGWVVDWVAGLEHVIDLHRAPNGISIDAINMSFSGALPDADGPCDDEILEMTRACEAARALGIVVFAAAGNTAHMERITFPACLSTVYSVGSSTGAPVESGLSEQLSEHSNRGPLVDIVAPGDLIASAHPGGGTTERTGTSQATPQVAAAALLLKQADPSLSPMEIMRALSENAGVVWDNETSRNYPRLDVLSAVKHIDLSIPALTCRAIPTEQALRISWPPFIPVDSLDITVWLDDTRWFHSVEPLAVSSIDVPTEDRFDRVFRIEARAIEGEFSGRAGTCDVYMPNVDTVFLRGDCNSDTRVDIGDPIAGLQHLFLGGKTPPSCLSSCDGNDDGRVDIGDAIYVLNFLFSGAAAPPVPYPSCGFDFTLDSLSCEQIPPCR